MPFPIIDTHTHVVAADRDRYPMQRSARPLGSDWVERHPVDAEGLLATLNAHGVHGAVLVQPVGTYAFDNSYVADAVAATPSRLTGLSVVDMGGTDRIDALTHWAGRGIGGTRLFNVPRVDPPWLATEVSAEVLACARRLGLRLTACILADDLDAVGGLLEQAGDVPLALDHCGFADIGDPASATMAALTRLAAHANLRLKVTTTIFRMQPPARGDERDVLERLCAIFGPERLMWGSDYPQHYEETYAEHLALARWASSRLPAVDQERFLGGTALELWPELAQ